MPRKVNIPRFVVEMGSTTQALEIGPRYNPPLDNTLILTVEHRTLGGGVSVLMDDLSVRRLLAWLHDEDEDSTHIIAEAQTTAGFRKRSHSRTGEDLLNVTVAWNGSGRSRSITLTYPQHRELVAFLETAVGAGGWSGWLRPQDVHKGYHGHVWRDGVLIAPCRLCVLQKPASH